MIRSDTDMELNYALDRIAPHFPKTREGYLFLDIVALALADSRIVVTDKTSGENQLLKRSAQRYIDNDLIHAEAVGIDPNWIRMKLKKWFTEHRDKRDYGL